MVAVRLFGVAYQIHSMQKNEKTQGNITCQMVTAQNLKQYHLSFVLPRTAMESERYDNEMTQR